MVFLSVNRLKIGGCLFEETQVIRYTESDEKCMQRIILCY